MSNKAIKVSTDNATWYTLPGNQGSYNEELNNTKDTIFGQSFESQNPNLGTWNTTANAIFKGVTGYTAVIQKSGTSTSLTNEACSLVSTRVYQITNAAHRVLDANVAVTVKDNSVDQTVNVQSVDFLTGTVTFLSTYTVTGPVTIATGNYLPMTTVSKAKGIKLSITQTAIDQTGYDDAASNSGYRVMVPGLRSATLELSNIFKASNAWETVLQSRGVVMVTLDLNNDGYTMFRGFFKIAKRAQQGNQGEVEAETVSMTLYVPSTALVLQPCAWYINASSKLNTAITQLLTSWQNQTTIYVQYLPSGATGQTPLDGVTGSCFPIDCSLDNALDGLNVFTVNLRGTGAPTAV